MRDLVTPSVATLRVLLDGLVEYAGLFPPAALPMYAAAENYAAYRGSPSAWALGRFIVPVARLDELATEVNGLSSLRRAPWRLSALAGAHVSADLAAVRAFNAAHDGTLNVDTIELRASTAGLIAAAAADVGAGFALYVEIPIADDPASLLDVVQRSGARAKVRTGGTMAHSIPGAAELARFMTRCAERGIAFKATAGLHHPLRSEHPLTFAPDAPSATMFGFLNLFLAAAVAHTGAEQSLLGELLEERDPAAFRFTDDMVRWREQCITHEQLASSRRAFALAFGSCSFKEPIEGLQQLALL